MKNLTFLLFSILILFGCKKTDTPVDTASLICDQKIIVDFDLFNDAPDDDFTFNSIELDDDCLHISFSYGGGCNDVDIKMIDANTDAPSSVSMRTLRLSLDDDDDCEAWVTEEISFDLTPIKNDIGSATLIIQGWDEQLFYKF